MPRRLVDGPTLARAVALRQSGTHLVSMIGGPIGGAVVAAAGFAAAAGMDAATFAQGKYYWPVEPILISLNPLLTQTPYWADKM